MARVDYNAGAPAPKPTPPQRVTYAPANIADAQRQAQQQAANLAASQRAQQEAMRRAQQQQLLLQQQQQAAQRLADSQRAQQEAMRQAQLAQSRAIWKQQADEAQRVANIDRFINNIPNYIGQGAANVWKFLNGGYNTPQQRYEHFKRTVPGPKNPNSLFQPTEGIAPNTELAGWGAGVSIPGFTLPAKPQGNLYNNVPQPPKNTRPYTPYEEKQRWGGDGTNPYQQPYSNAYLDSKPKVGTEPSMFYYPVPGMGINGYTLIPYGPPVPEDLQPVTPPPTAQYDDWGYSGGYGYGGGGGGGGWGDYTPKQQLPEWYETMTNWRW